MFNMVNSIRTTNVSAGQLRNGYAQSFAHMQKSVGARARADRPYAAKSKTPPLPNLWVVGCVFARKNVAHGGRGPWCAGE